MSAPTEVVGGGLSLLLQPTAIGPELAPNGRELDAFVAIVNAGLRYDSDGLIEALRVGEAFGGDGISVDRVDVPEDEAMLTFQVEVLPVISRVPRAATIAIVEQLETLREEFGSPPPWLFRPDPIWPSAHPSERVMLAELEARVAECDRTGGAAGTLDSPELLEQRRAVLADMESAGLMSEARRGAKLQRLLRWRLDHLAGWYDAAVAAERYIASSGRRRYVPDAAEEPVLRGPVCIDAFRGGLVCPPGVDVDDWASWGEWLVADQPRDGDQGEFYHHDEDGWLTVRWRRDHPSRPSLLALTLGIEDQSGH